MPYIELSSQIHRSLKGEGTLGSSSLVCLEQVRQFVFPVEEENKYPSVFMKKCVSVSPVLPSGIYVGTHTFKEISPLMKQFCVLAEPLC